jgi:hypothetical protein
MKWFIFSQECCEYQPVKESRHEEDEAPVEHLYENPLLCPEKIHLTSPDCFNSEKNLEQKPVYLIKKYLP